MTEDITVGKRLKLLRTERGLTQTDIAKLLGVTKGAVQKYESGEIVNFKADTIKKLSEFFKVPPIYFIYDEVPESDRDLNEVISQYFGEWYLDFMTDFVALNGDGQKKVILYCKDLARIEEYKRPGVEDNIDVRKSGRTYDLNKKENDTE